MDLSNVPQRIEPFVTPSGLRGHLSRLPLPEVLQFLRQEKATGILTVVAGGARKAIYLRAGRVVFGSSNLPNDRLGEILIREGKITGDEYAASIQGISRGKRQGRVLVEMGALSPKDLWNGVQFQIREIVYSIFSWEEGLFQFEGSNLPEKERITVDLDVVEVILHGIRRVDATGPTQARFPELDLVLERVSQQAVPPLEPYEEHVLRLIDGERSVLELCKESEIGDSETLKLLYGLVSAGVVRSKGKKVRALDQDFVPGDDMWSIVASFNQMYGFVFKYMVREVGPIAENVLEKYIATLRQSRADVFEDVRLQGDGTLDTAIVERNLARLPEERRRSALVEGLNELLYAELLAVKRTLGAEHEAAVIRAVHER